MGAVHHVTSHPTQVPAVLPHQGDGAVRQVTPHPTQVTAVMVRYTRLPPTPPRRWQDYKIPLIVQRQLYTVDSKHQTSQRYCEQSICTRRSYSHVLIFCKLFQRESSTFSCRREEEEDDDEELTSLTSRKPRFEQPAVNFKDIVSRDFQLYLALLM
jgi:hypothetical protein